MVRNKTEVKFSDDKKVNKEKIKKKVYGFYFLFYVFNLTSLYRDDGRGK